MQKNDEQFIFAKPIGIEYTIYIDEDINQPSLYRQALEIINQAQPTDLVKFIINSAGGRLDTAGAFLNAIGKCEAQVIAELNFEACSAATLIMLACDAWIVNPGCSMMIHSTSSGYAGSTANIHKYGEHFKQQERELFERYYKNFLTDDEIEDVLKGIEIWLNSDEILERLEKLVEERKKNEQEGVDTDCNSSGDFDDNGYWVPDLHSSRND